ncbi:reprolysin-like metallopeptidase [Alteromonas sp. CYL-A6]|uniref:reprolysin-like metallopeptidase n=1 Tax=Alteromonas nitratireducens TaxID=3390813 RepID=UPI0034BC3103
MTLLTSRRGIVAALVASSWMSVTANASAEPLPLFKEVSPASGTLPAHASAKYSIKASRQALLGNEIAFTLPGSDETLVAVRTYLDRRTAGSHIWVGHVQGDEAASVIITFQGMHLSGLIQWQGDTYRLSSDQSGRHILYQVDTSSFPSEEPDGETPQGDAADSSGTLSADTTTAGDTIRQDLLVAYTQGACNYAGSCAQLEADIATAVADMNNAYAASGINITMNLVATHLTDYTGTGASQTLSALRSTTDGIMDDIHQVRDETGADIVSLVYDGEGCGIGYLGAGPATAFNVTDVPCMVGNRTMAHEIGHNQGAHHDRQTVGGGVSGNFNYGFRRCNDGSVDDKGSPFFRTIMSYSCSGAARVGRFSNPQINYAGVPQGVDPTTDPDFGAWNARTLNESASFVASFRAAQATVPPYAPGNLFIAAVSYNTVSLQWDDNADNENSMVVQRRTDAGTWQTIASLAADTTALTDNSVQAGTYYEYRVSAENSIGMSGYSNVAGVTTDALPSEVTEVAVADNAVTGQIAGSYVATQADDGTFQTITEASSGGPKRSRKQQYDHRWQFYVTGGPGGVIFTANAWVSGSEGANFSFSLDGGVTWTPLFTVNSRATDNVQAAMLNDISGNVLVRATDAEQRSGESADSLFVDHLVMTSSLVVPAAPDAPADLSVVSVTATRVDLAFTDNANNETGFVLRRAASAGVSCDAAEDIETIPEAAGRSQVNIADFQAPAGETLYYWVVAFNGGGVSACSNPVEITTDAQPLTLSVAGFKDKGIQHAQLTWSGMASASVDIYRDGQRIGTVGNTGSYTDNIGQKGGGSYAYQVCEQGSMTVCSDSQRVTF